MSRALTLVVWVLGAFSPMVGHAQIGASVRQVIVATAPDWNTHRASLQCFQRPSGQAPWQAVFPEPVPVLLGKNGLAWGRGVFNVPQNGVALKDGPTLPARARAVAAPDWLWPRSPPIRVRQTVPDGWIELTIREGRNRQVRRMCAAVGLPCLRLIRWRVGEWTVDGLAPGDSRQV